MQNPILKRMNHGMGARTVNPILSGLAQLKSLARGNPEAFARMLAQRNPQFAQFMREIRERHQSRSRMPTESIGLSCETR